MWCRWLVSTITQAEGAGIAAAVVLLLVIPYFALVTVLLLVVKGMDLRNGIVMVSMLVQVHFVLCLLVASMHNLVVVLPANDVQLAVCSSSQFFHIIKTYTFLYNRHVGALLKIKRRFVLFFATTMFHILISATGGSVAKVR